MPPVTLPARSSTNLRSFWLVLAAWLGLGSGVVLAAARRDLRYTAAAIPIAAAAAVPGLRDPQVADLPYRAWNHLSRRILRASERYLTSVAFAAMLATRRVGDPAEFVESSPGTTGWMPRSSQPASAYVNQDVCTERRHGDSLKRYSAQPGHEWMPALVPVMRLLRLIEVESDVDETPPADIYTLY